MKYLIALVLLLAACAQKPTVVRENNMNPIGPNKPVERPVIITQQTRVIDARAPFAFALGHLQNAVNVQWSDFSQQHTTFKGLLDRDSFALARRLARMGIDPQTHVVVVGTGVQGSGEEGRLAWTLNYLGLEHVEVAQQEYFKGRLTTAEPNPIATTPLWHPEVNSSLLVTREELLQAVRGSGPRAKSGEMRALQGDRVVLIDVRSEREYLGLEGKKLPDLNAINIEWKQFYTADGLPNPQIVEQLRAVGIVPSQRLIVIDQSGVRSGAATYALYQLGYKKAGNYAGGFDEYYARKK